MKSNPLLELLKTKVDAAGKLSLSVASDFIEDQLGYFDNYHNFDETTGVVNKIHSVTILYSGKTGGAQNGVIATDVADRIGDDVRVFDNTKIGRLLIDIANNNKLLGIYDGDASSLNEMINASFKAASTTFNLEASGNVVTMLGKDASPNGVFTQNEVDAIVIRNAKITGINGEAIDDVRKAELR